jgi:hypothetical protein
MAAKNPVLADLSSLTPDQRNARRRTERSHASLEKSLERFGAARSIVIDEDGRILAGNGTFEAAGAIGIDKVLVVETDGDTLVAVQRKGLSEAEKVELALRDNRASDLSVFDPETMVELVEAHPEVEIGDLWTEVEWKELTVGVVDPPDDDPGDPTTSLDPDALVLKLTFTDHEEKMAFIDSLSRASGALPDLSTPEQKIKYVLDQFIARNF